MQVGKQVVTALALVASLGLVVPSTLGGSASADITHNPHVGNPRTFHCDLDGDSNNDTAYVESHYEVTYDFVSTNDGTLYHDQNSNTVLRHRDRIDVLQADYVRQPAADPEDPDHPNHFLDTEVEWYDVFEAPYVSPQPWWRQNTVRCVLISPYDYEASVGDAALEPRLLAGATYVETDYQLYVAKLSAAGKIANGKSQAHHAHKHHGKHRH